ncbi:MAG: hypothetical protein AB7L28_22880 [Kofleriaceae bacterium]
MKLLGRDPKLLGSGLSEDDKTRIKADSIAGLDEVTGTENIHVHGTGAGAKLVKRGEGADLIEEDGEQLWVSRLDSNVPRAAWVDVWGPLAKLPQPQRLEEFCLHSRWFDELHSGQPLEAERKLLELGYRSVGEYFRVRTTLFKYVGTPTGPNVGDCIVNSQEYSNAVMKASSRWIAAKQASVVSGNPELLAPVDGVTVDMYAQIAAKMALGLSQADAIQFLAGMNLDLAQWDKANTVWCDRMAKDTTGTIASIYGKAFQAQGQGQFGAAGQAVKWDGSAAAGPEPIPFEQCCEIQGATSAWAKNGKDVNALLKKHFNMVAMEWSAANTWWLSQLTANLSRFDEYKRKCDAYELKYADHAGARDQDLQF